MSPSAVPIHGRDHCSGGADPIPCLPTAVPWVRRSKTTNQAIQNGDNDATLTFDTVAGSPTPDYTTYFTTSGSSTIEIEVEGVYDMTGEVVWDATDSLMSNGAIISLGNPDYDWQTGWFSAQNNNHVILNNHTFTHRHRYTANTVLTLRVVHFESVTVDILDAYWEIHYVGSYTGADPETLSPPQ